MIGISGLAPRLLLDVESAARFLPIKAKVWDPNVPPPVADGTWDTAVVRVRHWEDAIKAVRWLHSHPHPFRSISLDSVSELQYKYVESKGENKMEWEDWGKVLRVIRSFCNQLRDMTEHPNYPVNSVVVTSMAKLDNGIWRPYLQSQMVNVIPYLFDINGFLKKEKAAVKGQIVERRLLYTEEAYPKTFIAGGRISGRIPSPFELNMVTGKTVAEIGKNNKTVRQLIQQAFAMPLDTMVQPAPEPVPVSLDPVPDEVKEVNTHG